MEYIRLHVNRFKLDFMGGTAHVHTNFPAHHALAVTDTGSVMRQKWLKVNKMFKNYEFISYQFIIINGKLKILSSFV